jgi:hypothetical protein
VGISHFHFGSKTMRGRFTHPAVGESCPAGRTRDQFSGPPIQWTTHPVGHWPLAPQSSHGIRLCRAGPSFHRSQSPVTSYRSARARKPNTDLVILQRTSTYNVVRSIRQSGAGCVPTGRCIYARSFDLRLRVVGIRL